MLNSKERKIDIEVVMGLKRIYKVIIWGTGTVYNNHLNLLRFYESKEEIVIIGVVSNDNFIESSIDGYRFYNKDEIKKLEFDYCIAAVSDFNSIKAEAIVLGVPRKKLIPIRILKIPYFNFEKYDYLRKEGVTILARNCFGGLCYHYFDLEFQSPTINMYMSAIEFNRFINNLDYYLSLEVELEKFEYDKNIKKTYPVGRLDDILLHFNHYSDLNEAIDNWKRRKERINKNNIVIVSDTIAKDTVMEFGSLPFENKVIFVPKELNVREDFCFPVNYTNNSDGKTMGMYINEIAKGHSVEMDVLSFLNGMDYRRIS